MPTDTNNAQTSAQRRLVIVESPAKARTIAGYLGPGFVVESSIGHIRDLPERAADIPAKYKKEPWARLGVDTEHDRTAGGVRHGDSGSSGCAGRRRTTALPPGAG